MSIQSIPCMQIASEESQAFLSQWHLFSFDLSHSIWIPIVICSLLLMDGVEEGCWPGTLPGPPTSSLVYVPGPRRHFGVSNSFSVVSTGMGSGELLASSVQATGMLNIKKWIITQKRIIQPKMSMVRGGESLAYVNALISVPATVSSAPVFSKAAPGRIQHRR